MPMNEHDFFKHMTESLDIAADAALHIGELRDGDLRWAQIHALLLSVKEKILDFEMVAQVKKINRGMQ